MECEEMIAGEDEGSLAGKGIDKWELAVWGAA